MSDWATLDMVRARLTYETIDTGSNPTQAEVQGFLDRAESRLRGALRAAGLPTSYTDVDSTNILAEWALDFAEGRTRMAWASADGTGNNEDGQSLVQKFEDQLLWIRTNPIEAGAELDTGGQVAEATQRYRSYITDNEDSKTVADGDFDPVITTTEKF